MRTVSRRHVGRQPAKRVRARGGSSNEHEGDKVLQTWRDILAIVELLEKDAEGGLRPAAIALAELRQTLGRYSGRFKIVREQVDAWMVEHRKMTVRPLAKLLDQLRSSTTIRDEKHARAIVEEHERNSPGTLAIYAKLLWVEPERLKDALSNVLPGVEIKEHGGKAGARAVQARLAETPIAPRTVYDKESRKTKPELRATVFASTFGPVALEGDIGAAIFGEAIGDRDLQEALVARISAASKTAAKK